MALYALGALAPVLPADGPVFVAPSATVIGNVRLEAEVSIWFGAVLRGDNEPITLGWGSNVQDGAVFHTDPGFPITLGREVTIGHGAIVHGCSVGEGSLIGMGATVLNGARIGAGALVGARALVTEGKEIPDGALAVGSPARVVRMLEPAEQAALRETAAGYRARLARYAAELSPL
jgi:carbonic anhydrase/acetyltransferase-like protein (isoleucine patch superfamily)